MKRIILTTAAILALGGGLAACETATPYQALHAGSQESGGYSDTKIEANRWRVTFRGNALTSRETVESYLLYRAAELTVSEGFDWFETVQRHTDKQIEVTPSPGPGWYGDFGYGWRPYWRHYGVGYGWRGWDPYWGDPFFDVSVTQKYEAAAEIVMGHGPKPADDRRALDAHEVMTNLHDHVVRPK
jgi:hypothetical protein